MGIIVHTCRTSGKERSATLIIRLARIKSQVRIRTRVITRARERARACSTELHAFILAYNIIRHFDACARAMYREMFLDLKSSQGRERPNEEPSRISPRNLTHFRGIIIF